MTIRKGLAKYLNGIMKERRLSIRALARAVDVSHTTIRRILQGSTPDPETLQKLADYLNLPVARLYQLTGLLEEFPEFNLNNNIEGIAHRLQRLPPSHKSTTIKMVESIIKGVEDILRFGLPPEEDA